MTNPLPANAAPRPRRTTGRIVHWASSASGGWGRVRSADGRKFFVHRSSFLDAKVLPKVGMAVSFTPIPKKVTGLPRAIEVAVIPRRK